MSTALLTDMYELTMLQAALADGTAKRRSVFEIFGRSMPPSRRFGVVAGTGRFLEALENFHFEPEQLRFLSDQGIVDKATINYLENFHFDGNIYGYGEGECYFPGSPLLTVESDFAQACIIETMALSIFNHDCAVASAASRMTIAAHGRPCMDFGARRTHEDAAVSAARAAAPYRVPLIGINQGHLGFLTQIPRENMTEELQLVLEGKYLPEERILIEASIIRDGETIERALALNDTVLSRGGAGQMIEFEVFINQEFVYTQRSDGLIISTPTGSTAYALAAGGPIMQAGLHAFTLVPICPQSMTNRPIAISDTSVIEILITKSGDARAHFDGQSHIDVQNFDRIIIRRYHNPLRVLHPTDYQYFKTLRQKLHWGEQLI